MRRCCLAVFLSSLLGLGLIAQGQGQGGQPSNPGGGAPTTGTPTTGTPGGTGTVPTTPQPSRQPNFGQEQNDPFSRGRGVSGRIIPSMGQRLQVELYLDGMRLDMTFTDTEGNFKFERQQTGRRYEIHIMLGPDQEYVEEIDFMPNFPTTVHIRESNIRSTRPASKASGTVISLLSLKVPKAAEKEFSKGRELGQKKKYDEALTRLQKAVEIYPSYAEAYNEIGLIHRRQDQLDPAKAMFQKAMAVDPKWLFSYLNLANLQLGQKDFQGTIETSQRVLQLDATHPQANYFMAMAQASMGHLDEAEKAALAADRSQENHIPLVNWLLARIYEVKGSNLQALNRYKQYLKESPNASNAAQVKETIFKLEKAESGKP